MPPDFRIIPANTQQIASYEWSGTQPTLLFAHATGFHARCWDQVIAHLPDHHRIALDSRGHGQSSKPAPPEGYRWKENGRDIATAAQALDLHGAVGIGHSWGGYGMVIAAALEPDRFSRLILLDPVIVPDEVYTGVLDGVHFSAKRRADWSSPDEMFNRFKDREPFARWDVRVLHDYCDYGLLPKDDGGFTLACPPAIESSIYPQFSGMNPYEEVAAVNVPVLVVRFGGRESGAITSDFSASPTAPNLASRFKNGHDRVVEGVSHFAPMEDPARIAALISEFITQE